MAKPRRFVHNAAMRFVFALLICFPFTIARAEDWPRWRGPNGDGNWKAPAIVETWPNGLKAAWSAKIGGGYAGVSVADGRVFTMDRERLPIDSERVLAFEAETGKPLWMHSWPITYGDLTYDSGPRAAPTIHEGRVYTLGAVGHAFCFDAATGAVRWSKDFAKDFEAKRPEWGFAASPFIWKDLVIFHVGLPGGCYIALNCDTGAEVWRSGEDPAGYATPIDIPRPGGDQLVCWTPENVLGVEPASGKIEWSIPYKVTYGVSIATPLAHGDLVFVSGYWEGAKAIRLGAKRTEATIAYEDNAALRGMMSAPIYRDEHGYLLEKTRGLTCFKFETGEKLWDDNNVLTPRGRNPQASLVWINGGDRAMALNAEGELVLCSLTPAGFRELARAKICEPTWAHPAYVGNRVLARDDTQLVAVDLPLAAR